MGVLSCLSENIVTTLPKTVYIENLPLGILYLTLRVVSIFLCLWGIWNTNGWTVQVIPLHSLSIWSEQSQIYEKEQTEDWQRNFCNDSARYDYQYDDSGKFSFRNISCYDIDDNERWIKGESHIFFPSFFQENMTAIMSGGVRASMADCPAACAALTPCSRGPYLSIGKKNENGECLCKCTESRNRFVTGLEQNTVNFEHAVTADEPWSKKSHAASSTVSRWNLKTVVKGSGDDELVFQPGDTIALTLGQLFKLAKEPISMSEPFTSTNPNRISGPEVQGFPIARMAGLDVALTATYYNIENHRYPVAHKDQDGRCKNDVFCPICVVEIKTRQLWTSSPRTDYAHPIDVGRGTGSFRYRYMYGVKVRFSSTGQFSFWDPSKLFAILAAIIVYIQMPTTIVTFIAQYLLGSLSVIYMNATCEPVRLKDMFRRILSRALLAKRVYELWYHVSEPVPAALADTGEGLTSSAAAMQAAGDADKPKVVHEHSLIKDLRELLDKLGIGGRLDGEELESLRLLLSLNEDKMTEIDFIQNVCHGQYASLEDVVKMYDVNRKHYCMERCFDSESLTRSALHKEAKKERSALGSWRKTLKKLSTHKVSPELD